MRAGKGICHIDNDIKIALVVFPDAVVGWAIFSNEFGFQ